eukprot:9166420-Pyramimonas_sp.AAC.1
MNSWLLHFREHHHGSAGVYEAYMLSFYQIYNVVLNHGMVYYVPVNYAEALFTMFILICSLTVMALVRSYISVNMMHQEDMLMQKRKDEEQVAQFIKKARVRKTTEETSYMNDKLNQTK